jgi:AcrR family transcriptional regulator
MPRSESANTEMREEAKAKILQAARKVFAMRGPAATMSEVAKEAGISQGLAYRYFPSKEAILVELVRQMAESGGGASERVKRIPGTPVERLGLLVSYILDSRREQPEFHQLLYKVIYDDKLEGGVRDIVNSSGKVIKELVRELIVEGQASGEIADDDPDQLVGTLMACLDGISRAMVYLDPKAARASIPNAKVIMRMLRPDPKAVKKR